MTEQEILSAALVGLDHQIDDLIRRHDALERERDELKCRITALETDLEIGYPWRLFAERLAHEVEACKSALREGSQSTYAQTIVHRFGEAADEVLAEIARRRVH